MPDERVIQQVYGILSMNKVEFRTDDTGKSFLVPYGSAGVFVDFRDWGDGQTLVNMHAFVLDGLPSPSRKSANRRRSRQTKLLAGVVGAELDLVHAQDPVDLLDHALVRHCSPPHRGNSLRDEPGEEVSSA